MRVRRFRRSHLLRLAVAGWYYMGVFRLAAWVLHGATRVQSAAYWRGETIRTDRELLLGTSEIEPTGIWRP